MIRPPVAYILLASSVALAADAQKDLHAYFQKTCDSKKFMGAVAVALNGKVLYSDACGTADVECSINSTVDTRFCRGSIARQFTAAAVLLLHEQGKVSLTDPKSKHLPELPESWRSATIHQLLTHTSGIPTCTQGPIFERLSRTGATPNRPNLVR